jgi:hypothetical protein
VRADVEVGEDGGARAAASAVVAMALARQEPRLVGERFARKHIWGQGLVDVLDPVEVDRDLRIDDRG